MDAQTGDILYEHGGEEKCIIASMSKIMLAYHQIKTVASGKDGIAWDTDYVAGEEGTFASLGGYTVNSNSTVKGSIDGEMQYIQPGEHLTMDSLLHGMMVVSGNDAAACISLAVDGSEEACLEKLHEEMRTSPFSLSEKTSFGRVYGRDCFSTPVDMAKMLKVILDDKEVAPKFWATAGAKNTDNKVFVTDAEGKTTAIKRPNSHKFISGAYREALERVLGDEFEICGKTGTWHVDYVLSTVVKCREKTLICVVLGADTAQKRDEATLKLLSWGFSDNRN